MSERTRPPATTMTAMLVALVLCLPVAAPATDVDADRRAFVEAYTQRFTGVAPEDFVLGAYAIDANLRSQYDAINEFPPYEFALDEGAAVATRDAADGTSLVDCLDLDRRGVNGYPYFDSARNEVVTLSVAVNDCRRARGEAPFDYRREPLSAVLAYLNFTARGTLRAVPAPQTAEAQAAYEAGKAYFYTKRGQLNLSCADCHVTAAGRHLREQTLAPLLGVVNRYPVYGLSWGALGTLHQRFVGCLEQVRAEPEFPQSERYRNLEYFLALMSNGLPMAGPGIHR